MQLRWERIRNIGSKVAVMLHFSALSTRQQWPGAQWSSFHKATMARCTMKLFPRGNNGQVHNEALSTRQQWPGAQWSSFHEATMARCTIKLFPRGNNGQVRNETLSTRQQRPGAQWSSFHEATMARCTMKLFPWGNNGQVHNEALSTRQQWPGAQWSNKDSVEYNRGFISTPYTLFVSVTTSEMSNFIGIFSFHFCHMVQSGIFWYSQTLDNH